MTANLLFFLVFLEQSLQDLSTNMGLRSGPGGSSAPGSGHITPSSSRGSNVPRRGGSKRKLDEPSPPRQSRTPPSRLEHRSSRDTTPQRRSGGERERGRDRDSGRRHPAPHRDRTHGSRPQTPVGPSAPSPGTAIAGASRSNDPSRGRSRPSEDNRGHDRVSARESPAVATDIPRSPKRPKMEGNLRGGDRTRENRGSEKLSLKGAAASRAESPASSPLTPSAPASSSSGSLLSRLDRVRPGRPSEHRSPAPASRDGRGPPAAAANGGGGGGGGSGGGFSIKGAANREGNDGQDRSASATPSSLLSRLGPRTGA
jgi:hypothetical protein